MSSIDQFFQQIRELPVGDISGYRFKAVLTTVVARADGEIQPEEEHLVSLVLRNHGLGSEQDAQSARVEAIGLVATLNTPELFEAFCATEAKALNESQVLEACALAWLTAQADGKLVNRERTFFLAALKGSSSKIPAGSLEESVAAVEKYALETLLPRIQLSINFFPKAHPVVASQL
jgi:tellurite resistance protein